MITQERLKEVLYYHPESGDFVWLVAQGRVKAGSQAGSRSSNGYFFIKIDEEKYYAHRLAFLYVDGAFPPHTADHKNTIRHDTSWDNLRLATLTENSFNVGVGRANTSGIKNIYWHKKTQKWRVKLQVAGRAREFGLYDNLPDAIEVCAQALLAFRGAFARV